MGIVPSFFTSNLPVLSKEALATTMLRALFRIDRRVMASKRATRKQRSTIAAHMTEIATHGLREKYSTASNMNSPIVSLMLCELFVNSCQSTDGLV